MAKVIVEVSRYGGPASYESDTLVEALISCSHDLEYNEARPQRIVSPDGTVLMEQDRIFEIIQELPIRADIYDSPESYRKHVEAIQKKIAPS